jgi:hypothetical protein
MGFLGELMTRKLLGLTCWVAFTLGWFGCSGAGDTTASPGGTGGDAQATGGAGTETGGASTGTAGASSETGGASSETGGASSETGGASSETGGASSETGGQAGSCAVGEVALRTRYATAEAPFGGECHGEEQTSTCTESGWSEFSGTFTHKSCTVSAAADCGEVPHGESTSRVRYASATVPYGETCDAETQYATCDDGALGAWGGSYAFSECTSLTPSSCGDTPHGELGTRTRYAQASVSFGSTCTSETQSALCDDGMFSEWSGSYQYAACTVGPAAPCAGGAHGTTRERVRYAANTVPWDQSCQQETQTQVCDNGVWGPWSGTYESSSCAPATPLNCTGGTHGQTQSAVLYESNKVPFGSTCVSETQTRTCVNGTWTPWSGTYQYQACVVAACAPGDVQQQACGLNGRGARSRTCTANGSWPNWSDCIDPDVCKDGAKQNVSCGIAQGWRTETCVLGGWGQPSACGSCSGTYVDPCLENKTYEACFAAQYDGFTCGVWNMNFTPARCEISLNSSLTQCYEFHSESDCDWGPGCSWTSN